MCQASWCRLTAIRLADADLAIAGVGSEQGVDLGLALPTPPVMGDPGGVAVPPADGWQGVAVVPGAAAATWTSSRHLVARHLMSDAASTRVSDGRRCSLVSVFLCAISSAADSLLACSLCGLVATASRRYLCTSFALSRGMKSNNTADLSSLWRLGRSSRLSCAGEVPRCLCTGECWWISEGPQIVGRLLSCLASLLFLDGLR